MGGSRLDALYRRLLITKFFTKGWGTPENLQRIFQFRKIISKRETCFKLIPRDYPVEITKNEIWPDCRVLEGKFLTPLDLFLPNLVPAESKHAVFQIILPLKWKDDNFKPICVHLAGTGDHKFWRRRHLMAKPLLKEAGIGSIILENPFYGYRKPTDQVRSCLNNVSDIFVMGGCLILECLVLFHWCERNGLGPLGVTGLSMGGHMASLAACNWPKPLVLVPCLSWSTASATFTQGVMSQSINWDLLELQYYSDGAYSDKLSKMVTIVDNAFLAGQHFAKNFNQSMEGLKRDMQQINDCYILEKNVTSISPNISLQSLLDQNSIEDNLDNVLDGMPETVLSKVTSKKEFELSSQEINSLNEHFAELHKESVESNNKNIKQINKDADVKFEDTINGEVNLGEIVHQLGNDNNLIHSVDNKNNITTQLVPFIEKSKTILNFSMFKTDKPKIDITKISWRDREALQFMRGVMDECTHLSNFSVPFDTSLIIAVCAKDDAYIPRDDCGNLEEIWPGSEVRYINAGHVTAYVLYQKCFRNCIIEAFERTRANFKGIEKSATLQL